MKDKFLSYKLIGDCAYSVWPWIYSSFKDCLKDSKGFKVNKNFIQNSTHMCVEYGFETLKGR